jgi:hypothetical protein
MPAGTSVLTETADAIKAAVQLVSGVQVVYQGKRRVTDGGLEDAVRNLAEQNQGYFWFSMEERLTFTQTNVGEALFKGNLMVRLDKDTSSDCNEAYDLAERVFVELAREGVFQSVGSRPKMIRFIPADVEGFQLEDNILVFEYDMRYTLPMTCG